MVELIEFDATKFDIRSVTKVAKLIDMLNAIEDNPKLRGKVALHGGTALNLFVLGLPRLSVDIDLNFLGSGDYSTAFAAAEKVRAEIEAVARFRGFMVKTPKTGKTLAVKLEYATNGRNDNIKVDIGTGNRSPLFPPQQKTAKIENIGYVRTTSVSDTELIGGKLRALLSRAVIRDLYDSMQISQHLTDLLHDDLTRRIILYYIATSLSFPKPITIYSRFKNLEQEVKSRLLPMLARNEQFSIADASQQVIQFLTPASTPLNQTEADFLTAAGHGQFKPELLFCDEPDLTTAALGDPVAQRKFEHLAQTPELHRAFQVGEPNVAN